MQGCPCLASHAATLLGPGLHQPVTQHVCRLPCMLLTQEGPGVAAPVRDDAVGANVVTAADGGQSLALRWTIAAQQASNVKAQDTSSQVASGTQRALSAQAAGAPLRALHGMHPLPSRDPLRTVFHRLCERGRRSEVLDEDIVAEAVLRGSAATSGPHALGTGQACALKLSVHEPWLMPTHFERKLQSACSATSIQATLGNVCWMQALLRAPSRAHPVCEVARRVRAQLVGGVVALRGQAAATMSCSLGAALLLHIQVQVQCACGPWQTWARTASSSTAWWVTFGPLRWPRGAHGGQAHAGDLACCPIMLPVPRLQCLQEHRARVQQVQAPHHAVLCARAPCFVGSWAPPPSRQQSLMPRQQRQLDRPRRPAGCKV